MSACLSSYRLISRSRAICKQHFCPANISNHLKSFPRQIGTANSPKHYVAPTMEQMRAPFDRRNNSTLYIPLDGYSTGSLLTCGSYYTLSVILGTVALSYGSVPMYKMVCRTCLCLTCSKELTYCCVDLPADRVGRSAYQSLYTFQC